MSDHMDEFLDRNINDLLQGLDSWDVRSSNLFESLASEMVRLAAEDTPRLSAAARGRGLAQLRASAEKKRRSTLPNALWASAEVKRRSSTPNAFWSLFNLPHWLQAVAAVIILAIAVTGVTRASADALPGAPLYGVKRFTEGSQLLIQSSPGERARLALDFANRRLDELQTVIANKQRVDPAVLDAIDESILRALNEIIATKGSERVALLKAVTDLAIRQQQIVDALGAQAVPDERARFTQTSKLLAGVASIATAAQSNGVVGPEIVPSKTETKPPTSSPTPSALPTHTLTPMPTDTPTFVPSQKVDSVVTPPSSEGETNNQAETPPTNDAGAQGPSHQETNAPEPGEKATGESKTPEATERPDGIQKPEPTDKPEATDKPEPTQKPEATDKPEATQKSEPTEHPEPTEKPEP